MTKITRSISLLTALLLVLGLCACGGSESAVEPGKYTSTSVIINGMDLGAGDEWVELKDDGTAVIFVQSELKSVSYTCDDGVLTLVNADGQTFGTGTLSNGTLTIVLPGTTFVFQKEVTAQE